MTLQFTNPHLSSGAEPTELLRALAFEYLLELVRAGQASLLETLSSDGTPTILAIIPNSKVEDGKIVDVPKIVPTQEETAKEVAKEAEAP